VVMDINAVRPHAQTGLSLKGPFRQRTQS